MAPASGGKKGNAPSRAKLQESNSQQRFANFLNRFKICRFQKFDFRKFDFQSFDFQKLDFQKSIFQNLDFRTSVSKKWFHKRLALVHVS